MKKVRIVSIVLLAAMILSLPAFAFANRASDQLESYGITISTSPGYIYIDVSVYGTDIMNKIGVESIEVYSKDGSRWDTEIDWDEDDDYMSSYNTYAYAHTFSIPTIKNVEYLVNVTIFAEDDYGRDTRSKSDTLLGR